MPKKKEQKSSSCFGFFRFMVLFFIPALVVGAVVASYLHYLPYKMPIQSVVAVGVIFFIYLFFIPHNAYYSSCQVINAYKTMKEVLKERIRKTLLKIGNERKSTINIAEFLNSYFVNIRNDNFASVATTVFPMLGILGTFISIAVSMPDFSVESSDALDLEISALLDGVGTAFYASIFGIFLSLWWIFFEKKGLTRIDKYFNNIELDFEKFVWDDLSIKHFLVAQNQMHNDDLISSLRENFNIHFMKKFNDSYIKVYSDLMEKTTENFQKVSEEISKSSQLMGDLMDNISKSDKYIVYAKEMDEKFDMFNKTVSKLDETMDKTFHKIDSEVASIVTKLADFGEVVSKKSDSVEKSLYDYQKEVRKLVKD